MMTVLYARAHTNSVIVCIEKKKKKKTLQQHSCRGHASPVSSRPKEEEKKARAQYGMDDHIHFKEGACREYLCTYLHTLCSSA